MCQTPVPAAIGLDVGGHGARGVLIDSSGNALADTRGWIDGVGERGVEEVEELVVELVGELRDEAAALGVKDPGSLPVGAGIPGFHDHVEGVLRSSPNFPGWEDISVAQRLCEALGTRVVVENDASCALLGEVLAGAARGCRDVVLLTLGTGVGGGFLVEGKLLRGARGAGAEAGHIPIYPGGRRCGCGLKGCLEAYASGPGLVRTAHEAWGEEGGEGPCPAEAAIDVFAVEAEAGGPLPELWASRAIERWCLDLAMGIAPLVHLFSPEAIVLAGGVSGAIGRIREPIERALKARTIDACLGDSLPIRAAMLGDLAGATGAASLVL